MYCKKCGKSYKKEKKVCDDCGLALVNGTPPSAREQKIKKGPVIVFGALVVVIVAVFLLFGLHIL